jgi:putative endonuclease
MKKWSMFFKARFLICYNGRMFGINTRKIGFDYEELAAKFLKKQGFKILTKNYTIRGGEIDLVAMDKDILVFVEVKARTSKEFGSALESMTPWKLKALQRSALFYIQKINWGFKPYRFDLVAIDYDQSHKPTLQLIKNIIN